MSESGGYRATCTELAEVSRDNIQDEEGDFLMMSMILNGALLYNIANCLQQRFAIAMLHTKFLPLVRY